jgi:hypothetical protein
MTVLTVSLTRVPRARLIVSMAAVIVAAAILWLTRGYTFYFDEWEFIQTAPTWSWSTYLVPHNEHPSILFRLVYAALLNTVGLRSYVPYMAVLVALHAANAVLLFEVVRRRAGDLAGMACAASLLVLGAGWEDLLWAFQMGWLASVASGLGMVLALRGPSTAVRLTAAIALLATSLMFSGIGLVFAAVAVVELAATPERRRDLVWFVPLGIALGAWYLAFGHSGTPRVPPPSAGNLFLLPAYVGWGLAGAVAGIIGVAGATAVAVLVAAVAALGLTWWRHRPDPLALGVAAGLVTFYVLTGLTRAQLGFQQSASGRYVYIGAVLWLILLGDAVGVLPWHGTWRPALVACLFLACFSSGVLLFTYATAKAQQMQREIAGLQALTAERTDRCLNPAGIADRLVMPQVDHPALYYRAIDRYGDPTAGLPITHRAEYDDARRNLVLPGCTG